MCPAKPKTVLNFTSDYAGTGHIGMAIEHGHFEQRQKLVSALETVAELAAGPLSLYVDGAPFTLTCYRILSNLQSQAAADPEMEVFVPKRGKVYGVKVYEPGRGTRWYSNERMTFKDADDLRTSYQKAERNSGNSKNIFGVDEIQVGENY